MKKKIYIHIGFGKTGTTAIQSYFEKNREKLLSHDFLYPRTGTLIGGHHLLAPLGVERISKNVKLLYERLLQEITDSTANNVLISSENFIFAYPSFIEDIRNELSEFDVKVVFYARAQVSLIESVFLQWQKVGDDYLENIESFFKKHKGSFDFLKKITPWASNFGSANIVARVYERSLIGDDVCRDLASILQLQNIISISGREENSSLRSEFSTLVSLIDSAKIKGEDRAKIINELLRLSRYIDPQKREKLISTELKMEISAFYCETNRRFAEKYLTPEHATVLCSVG